jgi:DNA-binding LacI/PurR family transcriptional regulator
MLAGVHHGNMLEALDRRGLPYAMLGSNFAGPGELLAWNTVSYDDQAASQEATNYLLRLGHRRIAFIGNARFLWFRRRQQGYQNAMKSRRLKPLSIDTDWTVSTAEYGQLAVERLLRLKPRPTAIFAANDEVAAGAWRELVRHGIRIPNEMSLVGFGDRAEFSILEPALTSVTVFEEQLGEQLGKVLLERLRTGNPVDSVVYPCRLIERSSTAPPAVERRK